MSNVINLRDYQTDPEISEYVKEFIEKCIAWSDYHEKVVHVIPWNDPKSHEILQTSILQISECWCNVKVLARGTSRIVLHNSSDDDQEAEIPYLAICLVSFIGDSDEHH